MLGHSDFNNEAKKVINWITSYFDNLSRYPVKAPSSPRDILTQLEKEIPIKGINTDEILDQVSHIILPGITHWQHPHFHAYFPANSSVESVLAEMITSAIGAQCMIWETSPAAAELEEGVLNWLAKAMGIPENWEGVIQDTASTATLAAIINAREKITNYTSNKEGVPSNLKVYCSTQTHSSIEKAVAIAGIGTINLNKIPIDVNGKMDTNRLIHAIEKDIANGGVPCCIVSAIGTTGTVAIDDVKTISNISKKYGLWHHIDAAYAGTALLLPEYQNWVDGIEGADSLVFNPHKWMFVNFDCSAYFVKDARSLIRTFEILPEYLKTNTRGKVNDYRDWGIPLGRRFRALKLWWVIKSYGLEGIQSKLRNHISWTKKFTKMIVVESEWKIIGSPIINFCTIRHEPKNLPETEWNHHNKKIKEAINKSGKMYISHTIINEQYVIRMVFGNTYLEEKHVDQACVILKKVAYSISQSESI